MALFFVLHCANGEAPPVGSAATAPVTGREATEAPALRLRVEVLNSFPHDAEASTQGLLWFEGKLFESTGLWGRSSLRRIDLTSGRIEQQVALDRRLFGEGLARVGRELVQLTWQSGLAIRYDLDSMSRSGEHGYEGEGWGLCFDGADLWRSDGSSRLWRHEPTSLAARGSIEVSHRGEPVTSLNELECAEGWIYANVWQSDEIVRIDPVTGRVMAVIDASGLLIGAEREAAGVLNGIAYRPESESFLLTGKEWPRVFETVFIESEG